VRSFNTPNKSVRIAVFAVVFPMLMHCFYYYHPLPLLYFSTKLVMPVLGLLLLIFARRSWSPDFYPILACYIVLAGMSLVVSHGFYSQPLLDCLQSQLKLLGVFCYILAFWALSRFKLNEWQLLNSIMISCTVFLLFYFSLYTLLPNDVPVGYEEFTTFSFAKGTRWNLPQNSIRVGFFIALAVVAQSFSLRNYKGNNKTKNFFQPQGLKLKASNVFPVWCAIYIVAFLAYYLFCHNQRMEIVAILIAAAFFLCLDLSLRVSLGLFCVTMLFALVGLFLRPEFFYSLVNFKMDSLDIRGHTIEKIIAQFVENPRMIFTGFGSLYTHGEYSFKVLYGPNFWIADVGWLGVLYEYGLIGIIITVGIWVYYVKKAYRSLRSNSAILQGFGCFFFFMLFTPLSPYVIYSCGELLVALAFLHYYHNLVDVKKPT
jgi:hypothetical protein